MVRPQGVKGSTHKGNLNRIDNRRNPQATHQKANGKPYPWVGSPLAEKNSKEITANRKRCKHWEWK